MQSVLIRHDMRQTLIAHPCLHRVDLLGVGACVTHTQRLKYPPCRPALSKNAAWYSEAGGIDAPYLEMTDFEGCKLST